MATYLQVYDSRHLQADCQEPGSAPEPYTLGNRAWASFSSVRSDTCTGYTFTFFIRAIETIVLALELQSWIVSASRYTELHQRCVNKTKSS